MPVRDGPTVTTTGRPRVVSDRSAVCSAVGDLIDFVEAHGGRLHPDLQVVDVAGDMQVHCPATNGVELGFLPPRLLVPVGDVSFCVVDGELAVERHDPASSALTRDLLELQVEVYRAAEKMVWARRSLPAVAWADRPADLAVLMSLRSRWALDEQSPGDAFIATRTIRRRRPDQDEQADTTPTGPGERSSVIFPVLELVNHHRMAFPFAFGDDGLSVAVSRPTSGPQCFVRYAHHVDVLDLAVSYGFACPGLLAARTVQVEVDLGGLRLAVRDQPVRARSALDAPSVELVDDLLTLSHLGIDTRFPDRALTSVTMAVQMARRRLGAPAPDPVRDGRDAVAAVLHADLGAVDTARRGLCGDGSLRAVLDEAFDEHERVVTAFLRSI